jgi:hypothetical protein
MQSYQYIDTAGKTQSVQAATPELAMQSAPNIAKNSGVQSISPAVVTSDTARTQVDTQSKDLQRRALERQLADAQALLDKKLREQQTQERSDKDREFALAGEGETRTTNQDPLLNDRLSFLQQQQQDIANQANSLNERLMQLRANAQDPQTNYLLGQVQQMYDAKRAAQEDQNAQLMRATEVSTIRTGIARLAQARSASIMSAEEDAGLSRLMEIEQKRIQAEIAAIQAYESGEMEIFRAQMQIFDKAAEQQRQVAKDMYTAVQDSYKRSMDEAKETREAIKFEMDTQDRIAENMANVLLNSGMEIGEEELAQVAAEYGLDPNTLLAKMNEQRVEMNKAELGLRLTEAQIANQWSTINKRNSDAVKEDEFSIDLTPTERRNLLGSGFGTSEIEQIEQDVNDYGLEAVLEGIEGDDKKKAVSEAYGKEMKGSAPTADAVKTKVIQTLTSIKDTYSRDEAETLAETNLKDALGTDTLPKTYEDAIKDAVAEVYGRTFWQTVIPGGR